MKRISAFALALLAGPALADNNQTDIDISNFANSVLEDLNADEPFDAIRDYVQEAQDLEERRTEGRLGSSDAFKSFEDIANENGFRTEKHQVVTDDGYILGIYRIPGALSEQNDEEPKPVVLLQHGVECDMMFWIFNRPEVAPAFILARAGYDVWLGNNRGNRWSEGHTSLSSKKKEFWEFSWEEMGTHDTPAVIDYILDKTGFSKINYIGHSEGTSQIMAGASLIPDYYKEKLNLAVLLAPPAGMSNNSVMALRIMSIKANRIIIENTLNVIHLWDILPYNFLTTGVASAFCALFNGKLCNMIMAIFMDEDPDIDYTERYDMYMSNLPAGAGYRDLLHYGQLMHHKEDTFRRYDLDSKKKNKEKYGQDTPPEYDLSLLDFPIAVFSGSKDLLADPKDVAWTVSQFQPDNVVFNHEYYLGHMSFGIAKDMSWFEVDLMAILNHYNDKCDAKT
mmetsp:Transcript_35515/g.54332  ORF Transcript_35515/g.54332 Transcript_35515/m.54332 type:complete len:452 (+) Transcript_35515:19-1374(+)